jgi:hypothetical protein
MGDWLINEVKRIKMESKKKKQTNRYMEKEKERTREER